MESFFLTYGTSAANPLSLNLDIEKTPVTHHITPGGSAFRTVTASVVGRSEPLIIVAAVVDGLISALFGEVVQHVVYARSETHVNPPTMSITIYSLFIGVLFLLGVTLNSMYLGL